jgi:hypothetical protein
MTSQSYKFPIPTFFLSYESKEPSVLRFQTRRSSNVVRHRITVRPSRLKVQTCRVFAIRVVKKKLPILGIFGGPTHRVRARRLNFFDWTSVSSAPFQRCDATGPTCPARSIPGPNLGQVCVGPDDTCVLPLTPRAYMTATDVTSRCWRAGACTGRDAETRNDINAGVEAQTMAADRRDDA